jgi:HK97 family phage major capsid protein
MLKLHELRAKRAALATRMKEAHEKGENDAFTAAETEMKDVDEQIRQRTLIDEMERRDQGVARIHSDQHLDAELRAFSLTRALAGAAGIEGVDWGRERELQAELAKRAGRSPQGLFIPTEIFETRVLTTSTGAEIAPTDNRPDLYISALTAASVVRSLGATVLNGLRGNVTIPRETDSPAIGWVAENAALSSDDADFGSIGLAPKHAGALSEYSRNMLMQSSPDVDALLRNMLARNIALAIDRAAIKGGGTNEPDGVLSTVGIQTVASPASLFAAVADAVAKADVENVGARRSILTTPEVRKIASLALDANGLPIGIGKVFHDQPTTFSNQVPKTLGAGAEHGLIFGDWSQLLIGIWSEIDILVNPFESTAFSKGNIVIRAMATVDCAVRHPKAFVSVEDVTTSTLAMPEIV